MTVHLLTQPSRAYGLEWAVHGGALLIISVIKTMQQISVGLSALLTDLATCLNWYRLASPGLYCCVHPTLELPDGFVLTPGVVVMVNHGVHRQATPEPDYERFRGAPNFIADVFRSESSGEYEDRRERFSVAGVQEYLAVFDTDPLTWHWHTGTDGGFEMLRPDDDAVIRSQALPGLWFPVAAFSSRDWWSLTACTTRGVTRRGHHEFMDTIWHVGTGG